MELGDGALPAGTCARKLNSRQTMRPARSISRATFNASRSWFVRTARLAASVCDNRAMPASVRRRVSWPAASRTRSSRPAASNSISTMS